MTSRMGPVQEDNSWAASCYIRTMLSKEGARMGQVKQGTSQDRDVDRETFLRNRTEKIQG